MIVAMKKIALLAIVLALSSCANAIPKQTLEPVQSGRRITIAKAVMIIEKRGPLGINLEWRLLPGDYVERYKSALGPVYESDGQLVEFTPTLGERTRNTGGFIVLRARPSFGKLYVLTRGQTPAYYGPVATSIAQAIVGPAGDLSLVTDFPLSLIEATEAAGQGVFRW